MEQNVLKLFEALINDRLTDFLPALPPPSADIKLIIY